MKGSVKKVEPNLRNTSGNCGGLLMGTSSSSYLPSSGHQGQKKRGERTTSTTTGRSFTGQGPITSSMEKRVSPRTSRLPTANGIFLKIFPFHICLSVLHSSLFGLKVRTGSSIEMNRPSGTTLPSWPLRGSRECYQSKKGNGFLLIHKYEILFMYFTKNTISLCSIVNH